MIIPLIHRLAHGPRIISEVTIGEPADVIDLAATPEGVNQTVWALAKILALPTDVVERIHRDDLGQIAAAFENAAIEMAAINIDPTPIAALAVAFRMQQG